MKQMNSLILTVCVAGLLAGCESNSDNSTGSISDGFPAIADANDNGINDYVEKSTHVSASTKAAGDAGLDHEFIDSNADGICDRAQDGTWTWHGPGYIDEDGDQICDYWDLGSRLYREQRRDCVYWSDFGVPNQFATDSSRPGYTDANRDGIRDDRQPRNHMGYAGGRM